jgi:replicative DNA helicase
MAGAPRKYKQRSGNRSGGFDAASFGTEGAQPYADEAGESQFARIPPHSVEAEQAVLGGLMLDNSSWDAVADRLTAEDFYRRDHQLIFEAIAELAARSEPLDAVTLAEQLERRDQLEDSGGLAYLATLTRETPSAANIRSYADIVRERAQLRRLIHVGGEITSAAFSPEGRSVAELIDDAERHVFEIAESGRKTGSGFVPIRDLLPSVVDKLDLLHQNKGMLPGISTGFADLDRMTAGLQPGDLIVVAGRPSMGKTTFALNIGENAAMSRAKVPVAVFSMEMSRDQLGMRMVSSLGRINQSQLRTGSFADEDWSRINGAINQMKESPIYIDDTGALTPTEVRARARRLKREHGLGLIIVDYLQLMQVPGNKENRATEISEISRSLKALAKELHVPVIALSQLNRSLEQRTDKKPVMSDLRESGAIEQDADVIMMIYREEVYDKNTTRKGIADIIIAKQRNGPTGEIQLTFLGEYTKFENLAHEAYGDGVFG